MNYFKVLRHVILFTGLWYGQEELGSLGYSALLILLECCTINICAADISQKVISLQLKGYALMALIALILMLLCTSVYGDQLLIFMASVGVHSNSHQQEMAFENADPLLTGEEFNMCELGLEGTYDNVSLCIYSNERRDFSSVRPRLMFLC
jgi:hypothetical protein